MTHRPRSILIYKYRRGDTIETTSGEKIDIDTFCEDNRSAHEKRKKHGTPSSIALLEAQLDDNVYNPSKGAGVKRGTKPGLDIYDKHDDRGIPMLD